MVAQCTIVRANGFHSIAQRSLDSTKLLCPGDIGEELILIARHIIIGIQIVHIVKTHMLITQSGAYGTKFIQVGIVSHKSSHIVFFYIRISRRERVICDSRTALSLHETHLCSRLQLPLPHRIAQHQFSSPEARPCMRVLLHGLGFRQIHIDLVVGSFLSCCKIYIQVDVQFAHQTVIIGIALPVIWIMGMIILMREVATSKIVLCIHPHIIMRFKLVVALHSGTQRVLVVNLPVKAQIVVQTLSVPVVTHVAVLKNIPDAFIGPETLGFAA